MALAVYQAEGKERRRRRGGGGAAASLAGTLLAFGTPPPTAAPGGGARGHTKAQKRLGASRRNDLPGGEAVPSGAKTSRPPVVATLGPPCRWSDAPRGPFAVGAQVPAATSLRRAKGTKIANPCAPIIGAPRGPWHGGLRRGSYLTEAEQLQLLPLSVVEDILTPSDRSDGRTEQEEEEEEEEEKAEVLAVMDGPISKWPAGPPVLTCDVPKIVRQAEKGDLHAVWASLDEGVPVDSQDHFGLTALHCAAKKGHLSIVELLLKRGAGANVRAEPLHGEAPLHYASKYGRVDVIFLLLQANADPRMETSHGQTPLALAEDRGHADAARLLLAAGAGEAEYRLPL